MDPGSAGASDCSFGFAAGGRDDRAPIPAPCRRRSPASAGTTIAEPPRRPPMRRSGQTGATGCLKTTKALFSTSVPTITKVYALPSVALDTVRGPRIGVVWPAPRREDGEEADRAGEAGPAATGERGDRDLIAHVDVDRAALHHVRGGDPELAAGRGGQVVVERCDRRRVAGLEPSHGGHVVTVGERDRRREEAPLHRPFDAARIRILAVLGTSSSRKRVAYFMPDSTSPRPAMQTSTFIPDPVHHIQHGLARAGGRHGGAGHQHRAGCDRRYHGSRDGTRESPRCDLLMSSSGCDPHPGRHAIGRAPCSHRPLGPSCGPTAESREARVVVLRAAACLGERPGDVQGTALDGEAPYPGVIAADLRLPRCHDLSVAGVHCSEPRLVEAVLVGILIAAALLSADGRPTGSARR